MPLNAAQLMVTIGANTSAAEQGIMGIGRLLGPGGVLGLGAAGAAVAIAGIGIASTKMAGDFQAGMVSIVTGAGESQKNLQMISDGVLQLSRETGQSTKQLTDGLYMIESGGYHGAAGLAILKAAAEGAKVGNADLGVVADATDTVLKNFGDTGLTATQAVNALITTVANGKTHMEDLAGSLSHILPTAAAAGVSLKDVMGAMATMTGEGVDAANAATYMRQMLIALEAPGSKAKSTLASIGLTSTEVSDAMHHSLPGALKLIEDHLTKKFPVGSAGYVAAVKNISGGMRQMQGMLLLTGKHLGTFEADTKKVGAAASTTGDTVQGWALVQQTFNQKMSVLGATFKTLLIQIGEHLLPVVGRLADFFSQHLPGALKATSDFFHKQILPLFNQVNTAVQPLIPLVLAFAKGMGKDVQSAATQLFGFFKTTVLPALLQFGGFFVRTILPVVKTFADVLVKNVLPAILPVVKTIIEKWLPPLERIAADILPALNPLLKFLGWLFQNAIGPGLKMAADAIGGFLGNIADLMDSVGRFVHNPTTQKFMDVMDKIGAAGGGALNVMSGGIFSHLPHFASGGVMGSSGLALVGEAGPEVVALPGGSRVYPNGGYGGGGAQTIIVQIDGRTAARAIVPHLHSAIRQGTGARGM